MTDTIITITKTARATMAAATDAAMAAGVGAWHTYVPATILRDMTLGNMANVERHRGRCMSLVDVHERDAILQEREPHLRTDEGKPWWAGKPSAEVDLATALSFEALAKAIWTWQQAVNAIQLSERKIVVHLMTQRNQPYGSERKCCERCGTMFLADGPMYTDDESVWDRLMPTDRYRRCS